MDIDINVLVEKRANCIKALNKDKHCGTCKHDSIDCSSEACKTCYDELLGMPINPTNWENQND